MTRDPTPKSDTTTSYVMASGKRKQPPQAPRYLFFEGNVAKTQRTRRLSPALAHRNLRRGFEPRLGKSARLGNANLTCLKHTEPPPVVKITCSFRGFCHQGSLIGLAVCDSRCKETAGSGAASAQLDTPIHRPMGRGTDASTGIFEPASHDNCDVIASFARCVMTYSILSISS